MDTKKIASELHDKLWDEFAGDLNDDTTRYYACRAAVQYMQQVQLREKISFQVVCDTSNNPPAAVDKHELRVDIYATKDERDGPCHIKVVLAPDGTFTFG